MIKVVHNVNTLIIDVHNAIWDIYMNNNVLILVHRDTMVVIQYVNHVKLVIV